MWCWVGCMQGTSPTYIPSLQPSKLRWLAGFILGPPSAVQEITPGRLGRPYAMLDPTLVGRMQRKHSTQGTTAQTYENRWIQDGKTFPPCYQSMDGFLFLLVFSATPGSAQRITFDVLRTVWDAREWIWCQARALPTVLSPGPRMGSEQSVSLLVSNEKKKCLCSFSMKESISLEPGEKLITHCVCISLKSLTTGAGAIA